MKQPATTGGNQPLIIGCCTPVLNRPLFARLNKLQVATQTLRPHFHAIVATGDFDRSSIDDLIDQTTLLSHDPEPLTTLESYARGLEQLQIKGVSLFFCLDHDAIYKREYIETLCSYVRRSNLDLNSGLFALNLIDQQWMTVYDDATGSFESTSFRNGLGLPPEEAGHITVGAPPTFVFGRGAASVIIECARESSETVTGFHDVTWRQALFQAGMRITQVRTRKPVFAYLRHRNNLCWQGTPVERWVKQPPGSNGLGSAIAPACLPNRMTRRLEHGIDVSVVIPTYNEGEWLRKTVESVLNTRTEVRHEIVVVDDGCTDGSVDAIRGKENIRIVTSGGEQLGLVIAKNTGAKAARGKYLCFADSHVLVSDYWLDYLRQTCDDYPNGCLVSGNLPDVIRYAGKDRLDHEHFGYIIRNCLLGTGWHHYGTGRHHRAYITPLTPGGLMFTRKVHFARLGGFDSVLRKWGAEDVQISLQNFCLGGENLVDPRAVVYHYYKNSKNRGRTFTLTNAQHAYNCLHVAATYFPHDYYLKVRGAMEPRGGSFVVADIESEEHQARVRSIRKDFVRGFNDWIARFQIELGKFLKDVEERTPSLAHVNGNAHSAQQGVSA